MGMVTRIEAGMNLFTQNPVLLFACINQTIDLVFPELMDSLNSSPSKGKLGNSLDFLSIKEAPFRAKELDFDPALVNNGVPDPTGQMRLLLWSPRTNPGATAFMSNLSDGMELQLHRLSRQVDWRIVTVRICDRHPDDYPGYSFCYYEFRQRLRVIQVMKDTQKWVFVNEGQILQFENPACYQNKRIEDRLNRKIIAQYLMRLGHEVVRDDFWESDELAKLIWI